MRRQTLRISLSVRYCSRHFEHPLVAREDHSQHAMKIFLHLGLAAAAPLNLRLEHFRTGKVLAQ